MKNPGTPEQLADAIESLVASYMNEVRLVASAALERSLARPVMASGGSKGKVDRAAAPRRPSTKRRTGAELEEICEELDKLVRVRPGDSMASLAADMGETALTVQRPMAKLKAEGRVRSVGERHLTRYFPAVVRASAGKV
jgi:hypothetical protein